MKWFLIIVAIAISVSLASAKSVDKKRNHHKKASSAKPTKTPKSIVEQFRGLPADDLAFIEQLDKQFQLHGEKVKIKVERDNTTQTTAGNGKNSKRTIDGSLSYGYHQNGNHHEQQQQFYFTKPRYEIFPYSHEDHSPVQHSYSKHGADTTVEITQSQGYEIKEIPDDYPQTYSQNFVRFPGGSQESSSALGRGHYQHQPQHQQLLAHEEVPVIVLKVPGPTKYAAHLRTLLQQYLEIRAAEVIRELQEQEAAAEQQLAYHQQQQQQQHHVQAQQHYRQHHIHPQVAHHHQALQTHVQYATPASVLAEQEQAYRHQQQQQEQLHYHHQQNIHAQVSQGIVQLESSDENQQQNVGHAVYGNPTTPTPEQSHHIDYLQGEYGAANAQAGQTVYEDHQTHYVTAQPELNHQEYYQHDQEAYHHHNQQQQQQQQQAEYHQQPQREEYRHHGHIQYAEQQPEQQQYGYSTPSQEELGDHHQQQQQHHEEAVVAHHHGAVESHVENPENYPDEKHTRVVFTKSLHNQPLLKPEQLQHQQEQQYHHQEEQMVIIAPPEAHHHHQQQHLQQLQQQQLQHHHIQGEEDQYHRVPEPHYLPTPLPEHQEYSQVDVHQNEQDEAAAAVAHAEENHHHHHHHDYNQQDLIATPGPFITITQKRKMNRVPFNYHAHGRVSTPAPRKRETPYTEDQFNKFNKLVHRLKKKQVSVMNERSKKSTPDQEPNSDKKKKQQQEQKK